MLQKLNFRINSVSAMLQHNGQLADQSNPYTIAMKEISSKRKKVEADYVERSRLEFLGGLYLMNKEPCIPGHVFEAALIGKGGAARKERMGKEAAIGVWVTENFPLLYEGPHNPHEMWRMFVEDEDDTFVHQALAVVSQSRVMRTRPLFRKWAADISLEFDDEFVDEESIKRWIEVAGRQVGLCDWRPKFGRFEVEW